MFVHKHDSLNANVNYCIGICFMKTKYDKKKAIPFLEKAVTRVSSKYQEGTYEEKKAHIDAWLYLGQAYRMNNDLDKALEAFDAYKKLLPPKDKKNHSVVDSEIEACKNAKKEVVKSFAALAMRHIPELNTPFSDYNPCVSANERVIVFATQQLQGTVSEDKKIMFARKVKGKWTNPVDISIRLKTRGNMVPTYITNNGDYMLLAENEEGSTAIYESMLNTSRVDSNWTAVKKLNKNINTGKVTHASVSPDGEYIYFTSDRKGGQGGLDIWRSEKNPKGEWGTPENLGSKVNTPKDEDTPFFSKGNILYFASAGHSSIGGQDLFYSKYNEKTQQWEQAVSMGYMFNTTDDDNFYYPIGDGSKGYMSLIGEDNSGEKDIYKVEIIEEGFKVIEDDVKSVKKDESDNSEKKSGIKELKESDIKKETETKKEEDSKVKDDVKENKEETEKKSDDNTPKVFNPPYTLLLDSSKAKLPKANFRNIKNVQEVKCRSGVYKYLVGEFPDKETAKTDIQKYKKQFPKTQTVNFEYFKSVNFVKGDPAGKITDMDAPPVKKKNKPAKKNEAKKKQEQGAKNPAGKKPTGKKK